MCADTLLNIQWYYNMGTIMGKYELASFPGGFFTTKIEIIMGKIP